MDKIDLIIINELEKEADRTIYQLAKQLGLKRSMVYNRITKLKKEGIIKGYHAIIDYEKINRPICAFILVSHKKTSNVAQLFEDIVKEPEVEEIHPITGGFDVMIKARFKDIGDVSSFILKKLSKPALATKIVKTETIMALDTFKEYFRKT